MPPSGLQSNSANEFLAVAASSRSYGDNSGEDDFDVARFSAIRKEQKDELERLEQQYSSNQAAIETQVRGEVDHLFQQFQLGMQQLYTNLTKTVGTTIDNQVQLRLKQERLRRDHDARKSEVEARYHNEASKLIISTSQAGRHPKPPLVPSQGLVPSQAPVPSSTSRSPNFSVTNVSHHVSPVPSSVNRTPPGQQRIPSRSLTTDDTPRERILQQPPRKEYPGPLPTPMPTPEDLMPHQRRLIPAEPRHAEPRTIEPRPTDPRVDTRLAEPLYAEPRQIDQQQVDQRQIEPRQVEQRYVEARPAEQHHAAQHIERSADEPRVMEQRQVEPRVMEQRQVEPRSVRHHQAGNYIVQRSAEQRNVEQHAELSSAEQRSTEQRLVDQREVGPLSIDSRHNQAIAARPVHEEAGRTEQQAQAVKTQDQAAEFDSKITATTPLRQDVKRKAAEIPISEQASVLPSSKRPRTRDSPAEMDLDNQSPMNRSPRSTRRSSAVAKEPRVKRTITFQEVYQDGKAQFKHKIFAWPRESNTWYIVRCDEHQVHFNNGNPIHGAAKHVHSPQHGHLEKRHDLAMEICGHLVLDCNAALADLNNREFERALKEDKYQVFNMNLLTKEGRRRLTDGPTHNTDAGGSPANSMSAKKKSPSLAKPFSDIARPEECKFYLGFWAPTKKWYMLIVLPIRPDGSLREVGLRETLQQTDLMSNVPKCYRSDRISLRITGWQPAYSDGGAKIDKREYPVMFFDSPVQKHSVGWLPAAKLRPVDLFNPPDNADKKGLAMARDWYAVRMMHRKDWEQFKRLGPGESPSPTSAGGDAGKNEQWTVSTSLRSAHIDDMSPIRDKSNGPGHFFGSGSSEEGSDVGDAEDPMTMDVGPIPEPADSNYVEEDSGSDDSDGDVEMEDAASRNAPKSDANDVNRPGGRTATARPGSRHNAHSQGMNMGEEKPEDTNMTASTKKTAHSESATPPAEVEPQAELTAQPEEEQHRKSAQAKAVAAVKEAASRSRVSSESPEMLANSPASPNQKPLAGAQAVQPRPTSAPRPPMTNHNHSRSEDSLTRLTSSGISEPAKALNASDLHSILNKSQGGIHAETRTETHVDQYKRFEAIRAQMNGLSSRPASVPASVGNSTNSPFGPPSPPVQIRKLGANVAQQPPSSSHIMSPPLSQSSIMVPARSLSTTPTHGLESGRNTPKILIPEDTSRWKIVHNGSNSSVQQSCASFVNTSASPKSASLQPSVRSPVISTPQLGTPIHDKQETFDVSQFYDQEGISWAREGLNKPFLRLITDSMRKWAETARESPLKATIEPAQVDWIETDHPKGDRDKVLVTLMSKHNRKLVLMFETNSANGRSQKAALQGRKFVSWVKRMNEKVEWRDETGSRPGSRRESHMDDRRSITVE